MSTVIIQLHLPQAAAAAPAESGSSAAPLSAIIAGSSPSGAIPGALRSATVARPPLDGFAVPAGRRPEAFPALLRLYRPVAASDASTEALERSGMPRTPAGEEMMGFCAATP